MTWKIRTTKRGQRSPPPLPMCERVVLKHVPTIVRRRYDSDLKIIPDNNNNQGLPLEDGKRDDGGVEDLDDNEAEDETHSSLDTEHDSQSFQENFGSSIIEPSMNCEDDGNVGARDLVRCVDDSVGNEVHEDEQDCQSKGEGAKDRNVASCYMNVSDQGEIQDREHENFNKKQAFHMDNNKSEGDGIEDGSVASNYKDGIVGDEAQDNHHGNYDNNQEKLTVTFGKDTTKGGHSPTPLPMFAEHVLLKHVPTFVVREYDKDFHYKFTANPERKDEDDGANNVEDNKSKGDGTKDEVQDNQHENYDNKQEKLSDTFGKDTTKEDQSPTPLPMYESAFLKHVPTVVVRRYDKDIHKFDASRGLKTEESKSEEEVEHSGNASSVEASVEDRIQVHGHAKLDANCQGLYVEDCKSEDDGAKDVNVASYYKKILEKTQEDSDNKDIIPEDFLNTLERDGYDLYCPNCKHYITRTLIFRRRKYCQECQQYQTTCFSFLGSLFCCIRW